MSALDNLAPALALLLDAALKATVVLVGALAATRLMRRRTAAARHLVWVVALAGVLALPALAAVLPAWKAVPIPAFLRPVATAPAPSVDPAHPAVREHSEADAPAAHPGETASESPAPLSSSPSSSFVPTESGRAPLPFDWRMALLAVWGIGGGLLLARLAYGLARVAWIERRATEITDEAWVGITDRLTRRLRVGRMVTLLREAHASVPMTWGIVRPVVLLPAEADAWDDERRTVVLAHELAHVRRWDTATQWIAHLALTVFWFHPLVWTAARRMREERERACDDAVLALGTRPVRYADHLLDIVRSLGQSEGPAAALAMARRSQFEGRLLAILDGATPRGGVSRGLGLAALAVAAIAVVPLAALRAAEPVSVEPRGESPRAEAALSARPADETAKEEDAAPVRIQPMGSTFGAARRAAVDAPEEDASVDDAASSVPPAATLPVMEVKAATVGREQGIDAGKAATLLRSLQEGDDPVLDVIRAAEGIRAPEERARVLKAVVERRGLRAPTVAAALRAAGRIPAPTLRRNVLTAAAAHQNLDDLVVRRAFFEATAGIEADTERRNVLFAVLERPGVSAEMQLAVIQAGRLPTSVERRNVLFRVMEMPALPARVASAVIASAGEMKESTERRNVLMRLLERADLPQAQLVELIGAVEDMGASTDQRTVLMRVAERPLTPRAREAYVRAAGKIDTSSDRALVLQALLERHPAATSQRAAAPASGGGQQVMIWNATEERIHGDGAQGRTVRIRAKDVLFGSAYWDVRGFQPGGFLRVEEIVGGRTRRVDVRPGGGGRIERSWTVDGQSRAYDSDAEQFLRRIIGEPAPK